MTSVSVKAKNYNKLIEDIFFVGSIQNGEVGIEIECEGTHLPREIPSYWAVHQDGSLRGESAEYVLAKPVKRENVLRFLQYLKKKLDENGAVLDYSNRTSVHVHLNMQGLMMRQVYNLICLYLLVEDLLVDFAGPTRVGNLFCLRAKDAEYLQDSIARAAEQDNYESFTNESRLRYSAINVCSLFKFNSLEFRALRGTNDPDTISTWVNILLSLKDAAVEYREPREIIINFSSLGAKGFLRKIFTDDLSSQFAKGLNLDNILWEGMRRVQDIAYATDWVVVDTPARKRLFDPDHPKLRPREREVRLNRTRN